MAASIVLLASCSGLPAGILVVPVGSLQHCVVFYLDDEISGHPTGFIVTALTVREKRSDGSSLDMWSANGAQLLRYITYGAKYPGLEQNQRPLPLKRGKRYEVFVYTSICAKSFDLFACRVESHTLAKSSIECHWAGTQPDVWRLLASTPIFSIHDKRRS